MYQINLMYQKESLFIFFLLKFMCAPHSVNRLYIFLCEIEIRGVLEQVEN